MTTAILFLSIIAHPEPHLFLRDARFVWTEVTKSGTYHPLCKSLYVSDLSIPGACERAWKELAPLNWERIGNAFYTPSDNAERIMVFAGDRKLTGMAPDGTTVIMIERLATGGWPN